MQLLQLHKALADDTRLRCLMLIAELGELCVCELTSALQVSQPKISRHLALLRENGLLSDRRQGQWVFYQLHADLPNWALAIIRAGVKSQPDVLHADKQRCQRLNNCCE